MNNPMNFYIRLVVLSLLSLLLLSGCGSKASIQPLTADSVVVAFGDSLTSGYGVSADAAYPAILQQRLGCQVINAGIPGEVSAQGLARLPEVIEQWHPDLMILCHGGNDLLHRDHPQGIKQNVSAMIRRLRDQGIDVILVGVPEPSLGLSTAGFYRELAAEYHLPYEGRIIARVLSSPNMRSEDHIHPNENGYRMMADAIADLIHDSTVR
jgi:acyl-CoA thioesterase-1